MSQTAILEGLPAAATFLFLNLRHSRDVTALAQIEAAFDPTRHLWGVSPTLLGGRPAGYRAMPTFPDADVHIPFTPTDAVVRISGHDAGEVLHAERKLLAELPGFTVADRVDAFVYGESRDLSGYLDGTENPTGSKASSAAFATDGSSVMAIQRWLHDLDTFDSMGRHAQDHTFGRDRDTNDELDDAPITAHVKRTAQEGFAPEAFVVRRSMPWRDHRGAGLVFVAFAATLDPFEALLRRMVGLDDGKTDALFTFTRPVTGATYWCPAVEDGRLKWTF
jgi:porphyrinogen peroxidase